MKKSRALGKSEQLGLLLLGVAEEPASDDRLAIRIQHFEVQGVWIRVADAYLEARGHEYHGCEARADAPHTAAFPIEVVIHEACYRERKGGGSVQDDVG